MCGILGITEKNEALVRAAAKTMAHRGPDAFGIFSDDNVTLGHNRLSIIDLDARSNQPMHAGGCSIVFNGEIYNFRELKSELQNLGCSFKTGSDTEVLLCAYRQWGKGLTAKIRGMYAFAIYDKSQGKIALCTDRSNMKPIVYAVVGGKLFFASEVRAILAMLKENGLKLDVDHEALSLYYAFGYIPAPHTLYVGVCRLSGRAWVTYDLKTGEIREEEYPELPIKKTSEEELSSLLESAVKKHLVADVPVGVFFSGGTDSSLIVAILKKLGIKLETFSVKVAGRPEDAKYFEKTSKHLGIKSHVYGFGVREFDELYPELMHRIDEPLYDNSLFPAHFIARKARGRVAVALSGEGGDEYFGGYPRSLALARMGDVPLDTKVGIAEKIFFLLPAFRGKNKLFVWIFTALRRPAAFYLLTMSPAKSLLTLQEWCAAKRVLSGSSARALDADFYLPGDLMRKLDMATMYCSIEGRVPLLDAEVISAAQALPWDPQEPKSALKKVLSRYLPRELVYRGKQGFGLALPELFDRSVYLKEDLSRAIEYLRGRKLFPARCPGRSALIARYPHFSFGIITLYYALYNAEQA